MPVGRDQADGGKFVLLQPLRGLAGIAARIDGKITERDAALHSATGDVEFGGEFAPLHFGIDPGDEQLLGEVALDDVETARNAAGTAGRYDHRIGRLTGKRLWQRHRESEESEGINEQYGSDKTQDHSIFLRDERTVMRAV